MKVCISERTVGAYVVALALLSFSALIEQPYWLRVVCWIVGTGALLLGGVWLVREGWRDAE